MELALAPGSPLLHISIRLNWREREHLLKLLIPTEYAATMAGFGAPCGSVLRPQLPDSSLSEPRWEMSFSRYLAVFDEGEREGLFVVSEAKWGTASNGFQSTTETVVWASCCCKVLTLVAICGLALLPQPLLAGQCKGAPKACV